MYNCKRSLYTQSAIRIIVTDIAYEKKNVETPLEVFFLVIISCRNYKLSCYCYLRQIMQLINKKMNSLRRCYMCVCVVCVCVFVVNLIM